MTSAGILKEKRDAILDVAAKYGAHHVRVFGSAARGELGGKSDIDLLVRMEPGRSLLDLVGLWQEVEELLGCRVDVISEGGIDPYIKDRIEQEAVPL